MKVNFRFPGKGREYLPWNCHWRYD